MLYTAAFANPLHHRGGQLFSVDYQAPEDFPGDSYAILAPSQAVFAFWRNSKKDEYDWQNFKGRYMAELNTKERRRALKYIVQIAMVLDVTLCNRGDEPHNYRRVLSEFLLSTYPHCWGGQDQPPSQVEELVQKCREMGHKVTVTQIPVTVTNCQIFRVRNGNNPPQEMTLAGTCSYLGQIIMPTAPAWRRRLIS